MMPTYKNIRIKMKGGKTRLQRVMVLASGKYRFVKNLTKSRSSPKKGKTSTKRRKSNPKRGNKSMGKRGLDSRKIFSIAKSVALAAPFVAPWIDPSISREDKIGITLARLTGFDPTHSELGFQGHRLLEGYGPFIAVNLVQKGVRMINKLLG